MVGHELVLGWYQGSWHEACLTGRLGPSLGQRGFPGEQMSLEAWEVEEKGWGKRTSQEIRPGCQAVEWKELGLSREAGYKEA